MPPGCNQWQANLLPTAFSQDVARKVVFSEPVRDNDDRAFFRIIEAGLDLAIEQRIHALKLFFVVGVFDLHRIVDDDHVRAETGNATFDRDRADAAISGGDEVGEQPFSRFSL